MIPTYHTRAATPKATDDTVQDSRRGVHPPAGLHHLRLQSSAQSSLAVTSDVSCHLPRRIATLALGSRALRRRSSAPALSRMRCLHSRHIHGLVKHTT